MKRTGEQDNIMKYKIYLTILSVALALLLNGCQKIPKLSSIIYFINDTRDTVDIITINKTLNDRPDSADYLVRYSSVFHSGSLSFGIFQNAIYKDIRFLIYNANHCKNYMDEHYNRFLFTEEQVLQLLENCQPKITYEHQLPALSSPGYFEATCVFLRSDGNLEIVKTRYATEQDFRRSKAICIDQNAPRSIWHNPRR